MADDGSYFPPSGINKQEGLKRIGNARASYQRFLDAFLLSLPEYQTNIQMAVQQQDALELRYYCHQLYSVSVSVGALRLAAICNNVLELEHKPEHRLPEQLCQHLFSELEVIITSTDHTVPQDQVAPATLATDFKTGNTQVPPVPPALALQDKRILLVEDEINLADLLTTALTLEGAIVEQWVTEKTALQRLDDHGQPAPHALICDIKLLDGCGFKVAAQFTLKYPDCPIVLMSGAPPEPEKLAALAHAELMTLLKPFMLSELTEYLTGCFKVN